MPLEQAEIECDYIIIMFEINRKQKNLIKKQQHTHTS